MLSTGLTYVDENDAATKSFFYGQMGDVYHSSGNREKAYEMYDKALSYNASNLAVLNNYSYFLAIEGRDLNRAERMSAQTVKAEPDNATYLDTYAWIFFKQGNYSLARLYMKNALDILPKTVLKFIFLLKHLSQMMKKKKLPILFMQTLKPN